MTTIRVALSGQDAASWCSHASRLHAASIVPASEAHDAVAFVGPAFPEKTTIERTLRAGKHVLLTAASSLSWDDLNGTRELARNRGVLCALVNSERYLPSRLLVREQRVANLGSAGLLRLHRWEPAAEAAAAAGLPSALICDLDLALWLVGARPNHVYALARPDHNYVQVHLGFPGGGMALLDYTDRLPPGDDYRSLSVIAAAGAAYADDHQNMQLLYRGGHPQAVRTEETAPQRAAILQDFVDAVRSGRELPMDAWQHVFGVAEAVRQSLTTKRALSLEDC